MAGHLRTRISSQCLKRHWRLADDPHALDRIDGADAACRSREIIERKAPGEGVPVTRSRKSARCC
ncbi:type I-E CRISPR-associated protein Cas7/Cse4/CasC [Paracoccus aminovorans]|uniref:type I-E CRISPR-associated protein Cas7/Cse4/CasC n=1 Tax=Paracoccus aminovorans TaxID=34004 RepID=UPI000B2D2B9B|nr:type I-E CRISPR-associated protein Cas7/Cse4/CasC [Paracoccus aminovorans]MDQ7774411.1 type I-E CRISPR-associated protein Cas7/Cse4/CasC [Paracoccus aminovorans]